MPSEGPGAQHRDSRWRPTDPGQGVSDWGRTSVRYIPGERAVTIPPVVRRPGFRRPAGPSSCADIGTTRNPAAANRAGAGSNVVWVPPRPRVPQQTFVCSATDRPGGDSSNFRGGPGLLGSRLGEGTWVYLIWDGVISSKNQSGSRTLRGGRAEQGQG